MSEMIERVARAICESEKMNPDDALGGWIHWRDAAIAAIEAMREPTPNMLVAAYLRVGVPKYPILANAYRAMIDGARLR